jgi:signal transduction histidine kinase
MKFIDNAFKKFRGFKRKSINLASLQLRLTLGITTVSLLGVGGIGTWTTLKMRQMLIVDHKQALQSLAIELPRELATTHLPRSPELQLQKQIQQTVHEGAFPNLWVWVKQPNGEVLMGAGSLANFPGGQAALTGVDQVSSQPEVYSNSGRYMIACRQHLQIKGEDLGQLYLAQDITHDYTVLTTLVRTLCFATLLAIVIIVLCIVLLVWRSLHPLRTMNRVAATQLAGTPACLDPEQVPSEVKELVQAFSTLSDRLLEAGEQQRQFTNSISHELRTSLCLISGYLQSTLRRGQNLTEPQKEALEVAASETERTILLMKDLLDLARINSGSMQFDLKPLILNDFVVDILGKVTKPGYAAIELEADPMVTARADEAQLARVLTQLVENAVRFSGGQAVVLKLHQTPDASLIQVCDRGCGISAADQAHIFEPFYRVDPSRCRSTGGIGLGLAVVKSLVDGMGGKVTVQSHPGIGSTFTVTLPSR